MSIFTPMNQLTDSSLPEHKLSFENCVLYDKWVKNVPTNVLNIKRTFQEVYEAFIQFRRPIDPKNKFVQDCWFKSRKNVKITPADSCYWATAYPNRQVEFWNFWNYNGPEFMYLYDYILYNDHFPDANVNKLWYLIAYVKIIAMQIDNPMTIVSVVNEFYMYKNLFVRLHDKIVTLDKEVGRLNDQIAMLSLKSRTVIEPCTPLAVSDNIVSATTDKILINGNIVITDQNNTEMNVEYKENNNIKIKPLFVFYYR